MPRLRAELLDDDTFKMWVRKHRYFYSDRTRAQAEDLISGLSFENFRWKYKVSPAMASSLWCRLVRGYEAACEGGKQYGYDVTNWPLKHDFEMHCLKTHTRLNELPVEVLELSTRPLNVMRAQGILTIQEMLDYRGWLITPNFGRKSFAEMNQYLSRFNLKLRDD